MWHQAGLHSIWRYGAPHPPNSLMFGIKVTFSICFWCILTGKRPFGVSLLYMGWDKHYGFQLYQSDPSGNYGGWKATCIGNNSAVSLDWQSVLDSWRAVGLIIVQKGCHCVCLHPGGFLFLVFNALTPGPQAAVSMLKQDYKEGEMTLLSALALAVKVLNKTMDVSKLSAEKGEASHCYIVHHH